MRKRIREEVLEEWVFVEHLALDQRCAHVGCVWGVPRRRQTIHPQSEKKLPSLVPLKGMRAAGAEVVSAEGATRAHEDGRGAEVESLFYTIRKALDLTKDSTMGGLSTLYKGHRRGPTSSCIHF
eukprot:scaffold148356_cov37-Tisochrysis_lutea.AAC.1